MIKKIETKSLNVKFGNKWQNELEEKVLYPKRVTSEIASIIDNIQPQLVAFFNSSKKHFFELSLLKNIYKNLTPLSVLKKINEEVQTIKEEQNLLLISEFNAIISSHIKNQPAPFIYERLGEKYKHFFIDEFQDTSIMQWKNLIPLIDNSLSSEENGVQGSLMLVGDPKQSIYRWRGGKAEQFIELSKEDNPYNADQNPFSNKDKGVFRLERNYRSYSEVISFNNAFFNPHSGHNTTGGGIVSSTGFKINDDSSTNEHFLDDDGAGNLRVYYLSGTTRVYTSSTFGTVNYTTGQVVLTSANITSISNVDGATSTIIRVLEIASSNDIVPVRNQI